MADRPVADGTIERAPDGSTQIRFVRRLPHPIDRVWEALTDPAELHRWWGDTDLELIQGGHFTLRWRNKDPEGKVATLDGTITKLDPPRFLEISAIWAATGSTGPGTPHHPHLGAGAGRRRHRPQLHQHPPHPARGLHHRRRLAPPPRCPGHHPRRRGRGHRPPRARVRADPPGLRGEVRARARGTGDQGRPGRELGSVAPEAAPTRHAAPRVAARGKGPADRGGQRVERDRRVERAPADRGAAGSKGPADRGGQRDRWGPRD